jgi:hypothetical protein
MRPIRSLLMFAAGATAATPTGRSLVRKGVGAVKRARDRRHTWHEVPPPGGPDKRP